MTVTIHLQSQSFPLRASHDFSWLDSMGEVFTVFDEQDSGNISFGVRQEDGRKIFVKYAGAETVHYEGDIKVAVQRLRQAMAVYEDLTHRSLIKLVNHFATNDGYAAVFDWIEGENLHPHWSFPPPAKYMDPASPFYRYRQLSVEQRIASLDEIYAFHAAVEQKRYVAVDFYDGSIMYDFESNSATDEYRCCRSGSTAFKATSYSSGLASHFERARSSSPPSSTKAVAPMLNTLVIPSIVAPFTNSSGDINLEDPHVLPI